MNDITSDQGYPENLGCLFVICKLSFLQSGNSLSSSGNDGCASAHDLSRRQEVRPCKLCVYSRGGEANLAQDLTYSKWKGGA